ncbi:hypothetical protein KTAU_11490 [Thermogemmatispora aurantia]|uniref:DUF790 domain-containing protein n=1 Tax=Thermogemmatispora aurantia TaxID=2045279 RepID=A0A5J4K619_9CHLR|nr:DUF790 family protein [Thermogemmatispora aurantia]GER82512.1 hypothetical protein KTAU_11490 [Thermogemmatispora aurantia]
MRLSLQDVKKQVYRRGGERYLTLRWLQPGELSAEIAQLLAYYEGLLGRPRRAFSLDEARACIGDYRLADGLIAVLGTWYTWQQPAWTDELKHLAAGEQALMALQQAGISSSVQLRLALFDYVNSSYDGFLAGSERTAALTAFAARFSLSLPELERLLILDSEDEACLVRVCESLPQPALIVAHYNQAIFEAALSSAARVTFLLDSQVLRAVEPVGLGAVIKRFCYLARRLGIYYDLDYAAELEGDPLPLSERDQPTRLRLTCYGPQEMTGLPQQYGQRLARLCRLLLEYAPLPATDTSARRRRRSGERLRKAIVAAEALVYLGERAYHLPLDPALLSLLTLPEEDQAGRPAEADEALFDSELESTFAAAFQALERGPGQGLEGWYLEREPEPLLLREGIFIPDFALSRGQQRLYVEILGFWTPAYRERKIQKLRQLQGRGDIILLVPRDARAAFASLEGAFPIVSYDGQVALSDLLHLLRSRYDDFARRLALLDREAIRQQIRRENFIAERDCYTLLCCYRRTELEQAAATISDQHIRFLPGVGLYTREWFERFAASFVKWVEERGTTAWSAVAAELRLRWPCLANCDDAALEALLEQLEGVGVEHSSIFETQITYRGVESTTTTEVTSANDEPPSVVILPAGRPARERKARSGAGSAGEKERRPRASQDLAQPDLWA